MIEFDISKVADYQIIDNTVIIFYKTGSAIEHEFATREEALEAHLELHDAMVQYRSS